MTEKQKYYLWFALIISICITILMEIFQLYTLPVLGILELFMLVNVCIIIVNLFIRKCGNLFHPDVCQHYVWFFFTYYL